MTLGDAAKIRASAHVGIFVDILSLCKADEVLIQSGFELFEDIVIEFLYFKETAYINSQRTIDFALSKGVKI